MANLEIPDNPIVYKDGRPLPWFIVILQKINATVNGILQFIDLDTGVIITADDVEQGINRRLREIVRDEFEYSPNGIVSAIVQKDPDDNTKTIGRQELTFDVSGKLEKVVEITPQSTVTETYEYTGEELSAIGVEISAGGSF